MHFCEGTANLSLSKKQARAGTYRENRALNKPLNQSDSNRVEQRRRDFGIIGRALQGAADDFVSRLPIQPGKRLLDVCCGTGIVSIPVARRGGDVTGVDPRVPFLSRGRAWAKNEDLLIRFKHADAERLPFSDGNFHAVLNFMGLHMADNPAMAAKEMQRVCRRRGLLAVAAWEASGLIGDMLRITYQYSGDDRLARVLELCEPEALGALFSDAHAREKPELRRVELHFPLAPIEVATCFMVFYPPLQVAAAGLEAEAHKALIEELAATWKEAGDSGGDFTRAQARYHELILTS